MHPSPPTAPCLFDGPDGCGLMTTSCMHRYMAPTPSFALSPLLPPFSRSNTGPPSYIVCSTPLGCGASSVFSSGRRTAARRTAALELRRHRPPLPPRPPRRVRLPRAAVPARRGPSELAASKIYNVAGGEGGRGGCTWLALSIHRLASFSMSRRAA